MSISIVTPKASFRYRKATKEELNSLVILFKGGFPHGIGFVLEQEWIDIETGNAFWKPIPITNESQTEK